MRYPIFGFDDPWLEKEVKDNPWKVFPKAGDRMMDIGANRGAVSVFAALNGATVVAYEPSPAAFRILQETIRLNDVGDKIEAINSAIHLQPGAVRFNFEDPVDERKLINGRLSELCGESEHDAIVDAVKLEDALGDYQWDIVKVDIEGYEIPLFSGCSDSIFHQIKFLTMEMHYNFSSPAEYTKLISRLQKFFCFDEGAPRDDKGMFKTIYGRRR